MRKAFVAAVAAGILVAVAACGSASSTGSPVPTGSSAAPSKTATATATPSATPSATPTVAPTAPPVFVGQWVRHGKQSGKPYTEHFVLNPDGTYSIEARFDATNAVLARSHGTYASTATTLALTDQNSQTTISPYHLDSSGKLVIDNKPAFAWTRVH
jgi:hypothetical protein